MSDCNHIHVTRWRSSGGGREPVTVWACAKCHAQFVPLEQTAKQIEQMGMEGYGTLAIAAAIRERLSETERT